MYKITLYDYNCCPFADGTASFFVDKLEDFEKYWLKSDRVDDECKDRFIRSKNGEMVTDYYTDDPKYNIVQKDENSEVIWEKTFEDNDRTFKLINIYGCATNVFSRNSVIKLRYVKFNDKYYLIGQYELKGVCREEIFKDYDGQGGWRTCDVYGNPVLLTEYVDTELWIDDEGIRRLDFKKDKFENDIVKTYCWVTIYVDDEVREEVSELSDEIIEMLMCDIPGEAG